MYRQINIFLLLLIALTATAQQITLEGVLSELLSSSFSVKTAENNKLIAESNYKFYKSGLRPTISLEANIPSFTKTSVPVTQPDGSITFLSISQSNSNIGLNLTQAITQTGGTLFANAQLNRFDDYSGNFTQYNGIPFRVGISQPLFGYNSWKYQKNIQALRIQEAKKQYSIQIEEAQASATALYFDIIIADKNLKIAQANEDINKQLLSITDERLSLGKVSNDQKLQLEIEYNQALLASTQADVQKKQAIASLYAYLGKKPSIINDYSVPEVWQKQEIDISKLLAAFRKNRPEIIAYQRELIEADASIRETNVLFGPQANIRASFGYARGADNVKEIYTDPFTEQQANLSITLPIVDWGRRKAAVQLEILNKENIVASYDQQFLELETSLEQTALALASLQNEIVILRSIMEKAEERAQISNERYILGDIDITNLTIAQREKDQAARNYILALRNLWNNYYLLRAFTGYDIITQQDISY